MTDNDRKHERATIQVSVRLEHPAIMPTTLKIKDMSYSGLFLLTDTPDFLPIGSEVQVQVITENSAAPVTNMKIVRKTKEGIGLSYR